MDKKDIAKKLQNLLELDREIVGVRLIWDEEDYNACPAQQILYKLPYCTMVKSASTGARIKARPDNMGCFGATMAFGMMELPPQFYSGEMYMAFQMYHDVDAAAGVANNIAVLDKCPYGLEISAIDRMDKDPDVVIIPTIPYNAMRIVQGYSCYYGTQTNFKMAGNQAICSEATTTVYKTQDINVTMMCSGTRYISQWSDNELAVGIPYSRFEKVVEGVAETADSVEQDRKKKYIMDSFAADGDSESAPELHLGQNYHTNQYQVGKIVR